MRSGRNRSDGKRHGRSVSGKTIGLLLFVCIASFALLELTTNWGGTITDAPLPSTGTAEGHTSLARESAAPLARTAAVPPDDSTAVPPSDELRSTELRREEVTGAPPGGSTMTTAVPSKGHPETLPPYKGPTEIVREDDEMDGVDRDTAAYPFVNKTARDGSVIAEPAFLSMKPQWQGKCWYKVKNFCVVGGQLTLFHDPKYKNSTERHSLRMCNEFSQRSPTIMLKYHSVPMPDKLPGPVLTKTKGWILQFWCQDLFHMTLSLMPALQTLPHLGEHPDIYIRIAKGVRKKKNQMCRVKLGDPRDFDAVRNPKWGGDRQFPFAGNPYWPFYRLMTPDPHRIFPLYPGATKKTVCYREGVIDKHYLKDLTGVHARAYSDAQLRSLNVTKGPVRRCGDYRLTFIDRRGKTRRVTNADDIVETAKQVGFASAKAVALEHLPIRQQLRLMTETDVLLGVHGNGLTWLQFLPQGSVVVELVGIWYMPYSLLFGHKYLHSSMKNNPYYKQHGEYVPFPANITELTALLTEAKAALDRVSCNVTTSLTPPNQKLETLYKDCAPHC